MKLTSFRCVLLSGLLITSSYQHYFTLDTELEPLLI